jgi:hypothetical protein
VNACTISRLKKLGARGDGGGGSVSWPVPVVQLPSERRALEVLLLPLLLLSSDQMRTVLSAAQVANLHPTGLLGDDAVLEGCCGGGSAQTSQTQAAWCKKDLYLPTTTEATGSSGGDEEEEEEEDGVALAPISVEASMAGLSVTCCCNGSCSGGDWEAMSQTKKDRSP